MLFLMQRTKLKYGTKTYHSKVPLRFIEMTLDYTEHLILKNRTWYNKIMTFFRDTNYLQSCVTRRMIWVYLNFKQRVSLGPCGCIYDIEATKLSYHVRN